MSRETLQWKQFRRLLLGTVVEVLLEQQTRLQFNTVQIAFDEQSAFKAPRFNNYMRFVGALEAELIEPLSPARQRAAEKSMQQCWMDLLKSIELPAGDKLTNEKSTVSISTLENNGAGRLRVTFDLEAD